KSAAGQDVSVELLEGSLLVREAANRAGDADAADLLEHADLLSDSTPVADRVEIALSDALSVAMAKYPDRSRATESAARRVWVDRGRERIAAQYEIFPRTACPVAYLSGTICQPCTELKRI